MDSEWQWRRRNNERQENKIKEDCILLMNRNVRLSVRDYVVPRFNLSACCICQVIVTWHKRPKQFVFHCNPIESTWFQELATHNTYLTTVAGEGYRIPRLLVLPQSVCFTLVQTVLPVTRYKLPRRRKASMNTNERRCLIEITRTSPRTPPKWRGEEWVLSTICWQGYIIYTHAMLYIIHRRHRFSYVWGTLWITESKTLDEPSSWYERYIPRDRGIMGISYQLSQSFLMDYPSGYVSQWAGRFEFVYITLQRQKTTT